MTACWDGAQLELPAGDSAPRALRPSNHFRPKPQARSPAPEDNDRLRHIRITPLVNADRRSLRQPKKVSDALGIDKVLGVDSWCHTRIFARLLTFDNRYR